MKYDGIKHDNSNNDDRNSINNNDRSNNNSNGSESRNTKTNMHLNTDMNTKTNTDKNTKTKSGTIMKRTKQIKTIRTVVTVVLLVALTIGIVSINGASSELPDPERLGSVMVHKFSWPVESRIPGTGLELTSAEVEALGAVMRNVGFTLYKVDDSFSVTHMTTAAEARDNAEESLELFTNDNGIVVWENLSHGYYVLSETSPPEGNYQPMEDVLLTIPMGITVDGEGWNYDIHVYPKNVKTAKLTKELVGKQSGYRVGDLVKWKIEGKIRSITNNEETYTGLQLTNEMDPRLSFDVGRELVMAIGGIESPIMLVRQSDYVVTAKTEEISIVLTPAGVSRLMENNVQAVSILLETTVNDKAVGSIGGTDEGISAAIKNGASMTLTKEDGAETTYTIEEDNQPSVKLSGLVLNKVDSLNGAILLDGAQFKIAETEADARNGVFIKQRFDAESEDIILTTGDNPDTEATEKGWAMLTAVPNDAGNGRSYYLLETKAPDGYVRRQSILEVVIDKDSDITIVGIKNQKIGNPPIDEEVPVFNLPKTGGVGTIVFVFVGGVMILGSFFLFAKRRHDRKGEQG